MSMVVNPGAGDVPGASPDHAMENMAWFAADVDAAHDYTRVRWVVKDAYALPKSGRWLFVLICDGTTFEVDMPGLPVEQVRYTGLPQNPFDFPRLYVDGSSWLWKFAVNICAPGEPEDDSGVKAGLTP